MGVCNKPAFPTAMSSNTLSHPPPRHSISKTVSATKNLRSISMSLAHKLRTHSGLSSTQLATQLAQEALFDVVSADASLPRHELTAIEKNVRRRLYDSLKVLISIGAVARSPYDKSLSWQGIRHLLPQTFGDTSSPSSLASPIRSLSLPSPSLDRPSLSVSIARHRSRLAAKTLQLSQLRAQACALMTLCHRNQAYFTPEPTRIHMPFVLIRTPISTEITLDATPDCTRIAFEFRGYYELVNDSSILDRLFLVERAALPNALRPLPQSTSNHSVLRKRRSANVVTQPAELSDPYSSPKRQRVASVSPFAKFTTGHKPPRSPAAARHMRRSPTGSPLQASLKALAGHEFPLQRACDYHDLRVSPRRASVITPPRKRWCEYGGSPRRSEEDRRLSSAGFRRGHRLYAQKTRQCSQKMAEKLELNLDA